MYHDGLESGIDGAKLEELRMRARRSRGSVLTATSVAKSGHPGGSFSSLDIYTVLYSCARLRPDEPRWVDRDRIVVSHGHTSPGVYCALAGAGFFDVDEVEAHFRQAGSPFEGHVERSVPGIDWSTGNLGQGLSAGVGMALGARLTGATWHTYVVMSDGEQHKGQVAEARRLAAKERLANITVVIDANGIQISGATADVMPVDIAAGFAADGWRVISTDGHSIEALHEALADAVADPAGPVCIVAQTVIGKGVSFMEDDPDFHGRALSEEEYGQAMAELGLEPGLEQARARRSEPCRVVELESATPALVLAPGTPRTYGSDKPTDNRSAWGAALVDLAAENPDLPMAVLDCDLSVSVKTDGFSRVRPDAFVQCGVGEHNAATAGGALSTCSVLTWWSDFGVFGCDEVYNQLRLNDINGAALKLVLTHCGLDVGEDGKTHQCLDYVGAFRNLFGWRVIVPADPNQTDRAVRAAAAMQGNVCVAMGRSKLPVITDGDGAPVFGDGYRFEYGRIDFVREGVDACVLVMGTLAGDAVVAADRLAADGSAIAVGIVACPLDLDDEALARAAACGTIITVEDHGVRTGLGAGVAEWLALRGRGARLIRLGVSGYGTSGASNALFSSVGLDADGIERATREALGR